MRISDRYIGKQVLLGTLYGVLVLSLVLVLGNLFKQIRPLLVDQNAPFSLVLRFVFNVLPFSLMFTVPWGFLSAVLLVFGRMSSDQEITSLRVAGVSLPRLAAPVFVIGALLSLGSLWLNLNVVPNAKATIRQLLYDQASKDPGSLLKPGVVQGNLSEQSIKVLIEAKDGDWVEGFHLYQIKVDEDGGKSLSYVHARRATLSVISEKNQIRAKLEDAYFENKKSDGSVENGFAKKAEPLLIDLKDPRNKRVRASSMSNAEILAYVLDHPELGQDKKVEFRAEITKRYSFSMACLAFAFIAVPLGLKARRRDTSGGLVISLLLGMGYFLFTVLVDQFETDTAATAILWAPNILCVLIGLFLFRKARFK